MQAFPTHFVIAPALDMVALRILATLSKGEVVAVTLTCRADLKSLQDNVRDSLRGGYVAADHCCCGIRVQEAVRGYLDGNGNQAALVQGNLCDAAQRRR